VGDVSSQGGRQMNHYPMEWSENPSLEGFFSLLDAAFYIGNGTQQELPVSRGPRLILVFITEGKKTAATASRDLREVCPQVPLGVLPFVSHRPDTNVQRQFARHVLGCSRIAIVLRGSLY
jgi:hypothetical protein